MAAGAVESWTSTVCRRAVFAVAAVACACLLIALPSTGHAQVASCNLFASPTGNDANPGTQGSPKRSPIALLAALAPGQTGCLQDNGLFTLGGGEAITATAGNPGQPKTLRPTTAGARATISTATGFWIQLAAHDLVFRDLDIRRTGGGGGSLFQVDGDRITLEGLDLTYPNNICLDVGDDPRAGAMDPTQDFVLRRSRIHHCGSNYGPPHFPNDSGVHGIYMQFLRDGTDADAIGALIEDNLIYLNNNRGIQLYPDTDDALIQFNVLDQNGANLNLGSEHGQAIYSERNLIENNILTDSQLSGLQPGGFVGDTSEVLGNFPQGFGTFGNQVVRNCISNTAHPGELYEGFGYAQSQNIENQPPQYADRLSGNFTLQPGDACFGKGPRPTGNPVTCEGLNATITGTGGDDLNLTGTAGDDVIAALGGHDTINGAGGSDKICGGDGNDTVDGGTGPDVITGGTGTDRATYATRGASVTVDLDDQSDDGAGGEGDNVRSDVENLTGGSAADSLTGDGDPNDIVGGNGDDNRLTGLGGNDTISGGEGFDTVSGGLGDDTLDGGGTSGGDGLEYDSATGGVTVDLSITGPQITGEGTDTITSFTEVYGSNFADELTGSNGAELEFFLGRAGPDDISGAGGPDFLRGGDNDDVLDGGVGADTFTGDNGNDTLRAMDTTADTSINCDGGTTPGNADTAFVSRSDPATLNCETTTTIGAHVRPQSASPIRITLVPAFNQCTTPNRVHGPPDLPGGTNPDQSCSPPAQSSAQLTVGSPDSNGRAANMQGSVTLRTLTGVPGGADDSDVAISSSITDVRRRSDFADYTGVLQAVLTIRLIDRFSVTEGSVAEATQDFPYRVNVPCATTVDANVGSTCSVGTSADAVLPGSAAEGQRSVWQVDQVVVTDSGADGNVSTTGDNFPFARQGVFVP